jgi:hypothetical protein
VAVDFVGPPPRERSTKHARIARELKENPNVWGVVQRPASTTRAASAAQAIRTGKLAAYAPAGTFEAVARTVDTGDGIEHRVYARYVGGTQ